MIPELTNRTYAAVHPDPHPVLLSPGVLRLGAASLVLGAAALWAAANLSLVLEALHTQNFIGAPLLFAAVAAALPIQLLTLTRPLVKEVMEQSAAPATLKAFAAVAVSSGSILTTLAWWQAFWEMCAVAR